MTEASKTHLKGLIIEICDEVERAEGLHKPMNSSHEAYAVILEELDEFWEEVRKKREERDSLRQHDELIQIAAMCLRTIINLNL